MTLHPRSLRNLVAVLPAALILGACASPTAEAPADTAAPQSTAAEVAAAPTAEMAAATTAAVAPAGSSMAKINLNTATEDELKTIPGLGEKMLDEFMEYRPYSSILVFRKEIGKYVTPDQVQGYEMHVFVPVKANDADADTLQQIPGVTADIAATLIAGRPYTDNAAFLAALGGLVTAEQAAAAAAYLDTQ